MNSPTKGKLALATQGRGLNDPWTTKFLRDIGSIHRLRWGDLDGTGGRDLIIAPLFGPAAKPPDYQQSPATILRIVSEHPGSPDNELDFPGIGLAAGSARHRGDRRQQRWTGRYPDCR